MNVLSCGTSIHPTIPVAMCLVSVRKGHRQICVHYDHGTWVALHVSWSYVMHEADDSWIFHNHQFSVWEITSVGGTESSVDELVEYVLSHSILRICCNRVALL